MDDGCNPSFHTCMGGVHTAVKTDADSSVKGSDQAKEASNPTKEAAKSPAQRTTVTCDKMLR